jgi:hypothetical protein
VVIRRLSTSEFERLRTWTLVLAEKLLPDHNYQDQGAWRNFSGMGGFGIHRESGYWHSFSGNDGGISPIALIVFLKRCSTAAAIEWAIPFLAAHPGYGPCTGEIADDDDSPASARQAQDAIDRAVDIHNTPAELNLRARKLEPPFHACAYLSDARCGEGAVIGYLSASGRTVGVELRYIDVDGRDSTVSPKRRRFLLEKLVEQPVFDMPFNGSTTEVYACEGLTDTLTVYRYGKRRCKVVGVPGVGGFQHLKFPRGVRVTFVRDGDEETSAAFKAMERAIDVQLLAGVDLYATPIPPSGVDASHILQEHGVEGLCLLLDNALKPTLSLRGKIEELSRLDALDYAQQRKRVAKEYNISVEILDKYVKAARRGAPTPGSSGTGNADDLAPWPDAVNGAELLDAICAIIRKHVVLGSIERDATTLWTMFTWAFPAAFHAPKLLVRSPVRRCGKTRLFEVLAYLTRRGELISYTTGSALFRSIERNSPCLLIDEVDTFLKEHPQLRGLINAGFDRLGASIKISVPLPGGGYEDKAFSVWAPMGLSGIGKTHETITDRSFVIDLTRKSRSEKVAPLRHRNTPPLIELARKAMRWTSDHIIALQEADPEMPDSIHDRACDAWVIPMAIADIAGGDWPQRARRAAEAMHGVENADHDDVRILADIRQIYAARGWPTAIFSRDLVEALRAIEDGIWTEYKGSWPISQPQLAAELRRFNVISGTVRLGKKTAKGYKLSQLKRIFDAYLSDFPHTPPTNSGTTSQSAETQGFLAITGPSHPDGTKKCDGPETPENPSRSAYCDGVTLQEGGIGEETGKAAQSDPLENINGAEVWIEGVTRTSPTGKVGSEVEERIRNLHHEHPEWSNRRIGREVGVTHKVVSRVIAAAATAAP